MSFDVNRTSPDRLRPFGRPMGEFSIAADPAGVCPDLATIAGAPLPSLMKIAVSSTEPPIVLSKR